MNLNTNQIVSISEANQNFSRVARMAEKHGELYIFKNNKPKYKLVDIESDTAIEMTAGLQTQRAQHYKLCSSFIEPWNILFMLEAGELQTSQVRWKLKNISTV